MKTIFTISILIVSILFSCTNNSTNEKQDPIPTPAIVEIDSTVTDPLETKELKLLITNHMNTYFLMKGEEKGLEFELLKLYAKDRGLKIKLELIPSLNGIEDSILAKKAHIVASSLMIPEDTLGPFLMTDYLFKTDEVLVRRKESLALDSIKKVDLYAITEGPYAEAYKRHHHKHEKFNIISGTKHQTKQSLIKDVAEGRIDYSVSDKMEAEMMKVFYPNIETSEILIPDVQIAFAIHPKLITLRDDFNKWLSENRKKSDFQWTIHKYKRLPGKLKASLVTDLPEKKHHNISKYDDLVKLHSKKIDWDWRMLSALIHQESKFNRKCKSFAGAMGLMQVMPRTGRAHGAKTSASLYNAETNILVGTRFIHWIGKYFFKDSLMKQEERIKFILASYNAGPGHVQDAQRLAIKYGLDPNIWEGNVEKMLLEKAHAKYFRDPVCKYGYCRGSEPVKYVSNIIYYNDHYMSYIK